MTEPLFLILLEIKYTQAFPHPFSSCFKYRFFNVHIYAGLKQMVQSVMNSCLKRKWSTLY